MAEDDGVAVATALGERLRAAGLRIAVAESLTAGHLQALISGVSGASDYFEGGLTAYNITQKVGLLGVDQAHAAAVNCVSERVAREMALGVAARFGVPISAATTGYAQSWGRDGTPMAWCATHVAGAVVVTRFEGPRLTRQAVQRAVALYTLKQLLDQLEESLPPV